MKQNLISKIRILAIVVLTTFAIVSLKYQESSNTIDSTKAIETIAELPKSIDEFPIITKTLSSENDKDTPIVFEFEEAEESFFFEGEDLDQIVFRATKTSGIQSDFIQVGFNHDFFGGDDTSSDISFASIHDHNSSKSGLSQLYYFSEPVVSLEIYNSPIDIKIKIPPTQVVVPELPGHNALQVKQNYKEKFFDKLGLDIVLREEWGAPTESYWTPYLTDINKFIVHHTVTNVDLQNPAASVMSIYNYHFYRCSNNIGSFDPARPDCDSIDEIWNDIGYNYLIDPLGNIYEGRAGGNGVKAAHAGFANAGSIGIGMIGTYSNQLPTDAALDSLQKLIGTLGKYNDVELIHNQSVFGHRDFKATACPGQALYDYLANITNRANSVYTNSNSDINELNRFSATLVNDQEIFSNGQTSRLIFHKNNMLPGDLDLLNSSPRGITDMFEFGDFMIVLTRDELVYQLVAEFNLMFPHLQIQPEYIYNLASWNNTDPLRSTPQDYDSNINWHHEITGIPEVWRDMGGCAIDNNCGGDTDITVAIVDSGIAYENYDFDTGESYYESKVKDMNIEIPVGIADGIFNHGQDRSFKLSPQLSNTNFANGYDAAQELICDLRELENVNCNLVELGKINHANDDIGHGTSIATIIAANTGDTSSDKIIGIAHNVTIKPIKITFPNDTSFCFDQNSNIDRTCSDIDLRGKATTLTILNALEYLIESQVDIINMSIVGPESDPIIETQLKTLVVRDNTFVIAPTGNNSDNNIGVPANIRGVVTVGGIDSTMGLADYSNFGEEIDYVLPAGDQNVGIPIQTYSCNDCSDESDASILGIFSSEDQPEEVYGTSFAAAQMSGIVALMKSKYTELNLYLLNHHLYSHSIDLGSDGYDMYYGNGLVDARSTIQSIQGIQQCPDRHFQKNRKIIVDENERNLDLLDVPSTYYIMNDTKYFESEMDQDWIANNCSIEKMVIQ